MNPVKSLIKAIVPASVREKRRENLKRKAHEGGLLECNYCGSTVRQWDPRGIDAEVITRLDIVPTGYRLATCPFCQSYDRDRLLYFFLQRHTNLFSQPTKLLHMAPELTLAKVIGEHAHIDYMSGDLDGALAMRALDVTQLDFPDATFDAVICNHVLEHVPDDRKAMSELLRVLKPGGWAVLQVPIGVKLGQTIEDFTLKTDAERLDKFGQIDHVRVYTLSDYVSRLESVGWQVSVIDFPQEMGADQITKFGLHPREKVVYCTRPS